MGMIIFQKQFNSFIFVSSDAVENQTFFTKSNILEKEAYAIQLKQYGDISYEELINAHKIPDNVIFEHYDGTSFTEDDFFCATRKEVN